MKKLIALSLALALALSLGVAAFAAPAAITIDPDNDIDGFDLVAAVATDGTITAFADPAFTGKEPGAKLDFYVEGWIEAFDVASGTPAVKNGVWDAGEEAALTEKQFKDNFTLTYNVKKGEVASVSIKAAETTKWAYIRIELKKTYSASTFDLEVDLRIRDKNTGDVAVFTVEGEKIGYNEDDAALVIDVKDDGGPVFDYDEFDDERKEFDLTYGGIFEANYKGVESGKKYLGAIVTATTDLYKTYEDIDFDEINFQGKPSLAGTATCRFYTDDDMVALYTYADGKLTPVADASYNKTEGCWIFKTRTLGHYVASSEVIKDAVDPAKPNPETGANGFVNLAVVAAIVSLAAVGAVALKK